MNRHWGIGWAILFAGICSSGVSLGQVILGPEGPVNLQKQKTTPRGDGPQVYRLTIDPAPEPEPALKHSLLPDYVSRKPGNGVPYYYRALLMFREKDAETRRSLEGWYEMPLDELPVDDVKRAIDSYRSVFQTLETAALREQCDWQWRIRDLKGLEQIIGFLLPEIGDARSLSRVLSLKARLEIADGLYDEAIETLAIGYKMAQDVAEPATLVNDLVGIAIANTMNDRLRELIDAPGSPNLYWALAELPRPLIDTREAIKHEMSMPLMAFPFLKDADIARRTPEAWRDLIIESFREVTQLTDGGMPDVAAPLAAVGLVCIGYPRARDELIASGFSREQVEQMPVGQVVAIHQSRSHNHMYHEIFKWMTLPFDQAWERQKQAEQRLKKEGYFGRLGHSGEIIPVGTLLPPVSYAWRAEVELSARLAALQALEAIRMHAAASDSQLPETLDEIRAVPVPKDPITGESFVYRRDGLTAILEFPETLAVPAERTWRLEITLSAN